MLGVVQLTNEPTCVGATIHRSAYLVKLSYSVFVLRSGLSTAHVGCIGGHACMRHTFSVPILYTPVVRCLVAPGTTRLHYGVFSVSFVIFLPKCCCSRCREQQHAFG